jgi:hypothetical protein
MPRYTLPEEHPLNADYRAWRREWAAIALGRPIKKLKRFSHLPPVIPDDAEAEALNVPDE